MTQREFKPRERKNKRERGKKERKKTHRRDVYVSSCKEERKIKKRTRRRGRKSIGLLLSGNRELIVCDSSFILIVHFLQYNFESYNTTIYSNDRHASRNACHKFEDL